MKKAKKNDLSASTAKVNTDDARIDALNRPESKPDIERMERIMNCSNEKPP